MRKADGLTIGSLESSLKKLVENDVAFLNEIPFALITSLDSEIALSSSIIGRTIIEGYPKCKFLGPGIVFPQGLLFEIHNSLDIFHGFDEAWFFTKEPTLQKPNDGWLVGPLDLNLENLAPSLVHWMSESGCNLGLGDGTGLNVATQNEEIAKAIERGSTIVSPITR